MGKQFGRLRENRRLQVSCHPADARKAAVGGYERLDGDLERQRPEALYEGLREAAFRERCKIHDIVLEGIEMALRKRGRTA